MAITNDKSIISKGILRYYHQRMEARITDFLSKKVDKEVGKGLSEENFTQQDKQKLNSLENYSLSKATDSTLGGIKTGYITTGKNYSVELDSQSNAFVTVPWTDTVTNYNVATEEMNGLMGMNMVKKLNSLRTIYKGTGDVPPSEWVDGDIYIQYEE